MVVKGRGPTLLMIPGLQGRWEWARPCVDELAKHLRVATYSLSGERESVPPFAARSFDDLVRQAVNAIRRVSTSPIVVCGVSYGGLIATRLAARHPDLIRGVVLASPLNADYAPDDATQRLLEHPRLLAPLFLAGAPGRVVPELRAAHGPGWLPQGVALLGHVIGAPQSPARMADRIRFLAREDLVSDCRQVSQPTLLVTGEPGLDRIVPAGESRRMLEWLPNARHVTLARTGHWGLVTRRATFARVVSGFVESLS